MKNQILLTFLVATAGTAASADDFNWKVGAVGPWSNTDNWNGPGFPDSANDNAAVAGASSKAYVDMDLTVNNLLVSGGAQVHNEYFGPSHLWVAGDATVDGLNSLLHIVPEGPLDFQVDALTLSDWGQFFLDDGYALINESAWIGDNGYIKGRGLINMHSAAGDFTLATGADIIASSGVLTLDTFGESARMDWGQSAWKIAVWPNAGFEMMLKPKNSMNGFIDIADGATFESEHPWVATPNSLIEIGSGGQLIGTVIDTHGTVQVSGGAGIGASIGGQLLAFRGDIILGEPVLYVNGTTLLDGATITTKQGADGTLGWGILTNTVIVQGDTTVNTTGGFDLDGVNGTLEFIIDDDASLVLNVAQYDAVEDDFDSNLVVRGSIFLNGPLLDNDGVITMDGGAVFGNTIYNFGSIEGHGAITNFVINNSEIVAGGGTLQLASNTLLDGGFETGHVYAVEGDIVLAGGDHDQHFNGTMMVGDGEGVEEVFDMDGDLTISQDFGVDGSLTLNAGRVFANSISLESQFDSEGHSFLQTPNAQSSHVSFRTGSTNAISGELEIWSDAVIETGAAFSGDGEVKTFPNRTLLLRANANLGSVGLVNAGLATLEGPETGHVQVGAFTQLDSGLYHTTVSAGGHDKLVSDTTVVLDGDLHVGVTNGFVPTIGASYTIIEGEQVSGQFDAVTSDPEIGKVVVAVSDVDVVITITCQADSNGDGVLNILDFVDFQQKWEAGHPEADCDGNGFFNILDFICFQVMFQNGC